ncbi:class I SAM-dependent methyltransferase [Desulfobacter hydrogenophilus]|uniref:Class I SAM-dependent methyltransferase n=1 Tax=Desulfobacter hydrogenophilus TaxID=2291 RepID=A0A328FG53_9BACT|nr:class I SAM-dependent methyltransferase [Desulfobacter hydrogenophilus]NDY70711.1 methyltransferase domain-containing protein [Desulfobacter hydrogenophilus]QBH12676.1 class I SAM-dependent methyltransferase [Desulfobacter hydrogenophilus]RAM03359.1 class I SAM-dependent methyltransferase [Desulfobacter hydrogenophilus]
MISSVKTHYTRPGLGAKIRQGLEKAGKIPEQINLRDLAPVDQLHTGGGAATLELVAQAGLDKGMTILDAGCGIGGTSRLLAQKFGLVVHGIDLSKDFIETANVLNQWCGFAEDGTINLKQGSLMALPYPDNFFDAVLCQHVLLNIKDKPKAFAELSRVLASRGKLILHEIVDGPGPAPRYPVPWAANESASMLCSRQDLGEYAKKAGFELVFSEDKTHSAALWWKKINAIKKARGTGPLNPGLVFGENAGQFGANMEQNFKEQAVLCVEYIWIKSNFI